MDFLITKIQVNQNFKQFQHINNKLLLTIQ
jgi:hypothetical protein